MPKGDLVIVARSDPRGPAGPAREGIQCGNKWCSRSQDSRRASRVSKNNNIPITVSIDSDTADKLGVELNHTSGRMGSKAEKKSKVQ
jgi:hypothetical protein